MTRLYAAQKLPQAIESASRETANRLLDQRRKGTLMSQAMIIRLLRATGDISPAMQAEKFRRPYRRPNFGSAA